MPRPSRRDDLLHALTDLGGVAEASELVAASTWAALRAAVAAKEVVRVGHGVYALEAMAEPGLGGAAPSRAWSRWNVGPDDAERRAMSARIAVARSHDGALSHRCAAAHHGWPILKAPEEVELAVPPGRNLHRRRSSGRVRTSARVRLRHRLLDADERRDRVTSPVGTVLDCARDLPFREALAVADSALRSGTVGAHELREAGDRYIGPREEAVVLVTSQAQGGAANPFESAVRAAIGDVFGWNLVTQFEIVDAGFSARVDLADAGRRVVVEADSYEFHGSVDRFAADRRRYAELTCRDWLVLPFTFGAVMNDPAWVRATGRAALIVRDRQRCRAV